MALENEVFQRAGPTHSLTSQTDHFAISQPKYQRKYGIAMLCKYLVQKHQFYSLVCVRLS